MLQFFSSFEHGPWRNSSLPILFKGLSLWWASARRGVFCLQVINYGTIFLNMALGDHSSVINPYDLSLLFWGILWTHVWPPGVPQHGGVSWFLLSLAIVTHAFLHVGACPQHLLHFRTSPQGNKWNCWGVVFPNGPKRSHFQREWTWHRVKKLLLRLWKFHLTYLHFPAPESYLQWHFVAALNVKWSFCGITYQLRKISWFWVQLFPSCGTYLR